MPRALRLHIAGGFYHVTLRGNHRQAIFFNDTDRNVLDAVVAEAIERHAALLHAYCWMTNHIHLLIQVGESPLSGIMQCIGSRFARHVQRRLDTTGHLFERRYHTEIIDSDAYLLTVLRYIHLNPVTAGLARHPDEYPWSSHRCYLGVRQQRWVTTRFAMGMLAQDPVIALQKYRDLVADALDGPVPTSQCAMIDRRHLMGGEPLFEPPIDKASRAQSVLDCFIGEVCRDHGISRALLCSAARHRTVTRLRVTVARRALATGQVTVADVARAFGRSHSAVAALLERHGGHELREPLNGMLEGWNPAPINKMLYRSNPAPIDSSDECAGCAGSRKELTSP
jgi:putative transposase